MAAAGARLPLDPDLELEVTRPSLPGENDLAGQRWARLLGAGMSSPAVGSGRGVRCDHGDPAPGPGPVGIHVEVRHLQTWPAALVDLWVEPGWSVPMRGARREGRPVTRGAAQSVPRVRR